jgi:hypothetical protein
MYHRRIRMIGLIVAGAIISGCDTGKGSPIIEVEVKLSAIKFDDLEKQIETQKGKVVVVDCWAMW